MDLTTQQPQHIWQIFINSFELFKKTWIRLWPLTIFLMVAVLSPSLIIYNPEYPILFIGYFIFSVFIFSSALYYTLHVNEGQELSLKKSISIAAKKFPIVIVTTIVAMILTIIAYGFLIVPGVIITVWFSMCLPLILLENAGPFDVLQKSYELTTDDWARTAMVIFFPFVITSLVGFVFAQMFLLLKLNVLYYELLIVFFVGFLSIFYLPWVAALLTVQFKDLKSRKVFRALNPLPQEFVGQQRIL